MMHDMMWAGWIRCIVGILLVVLIAILNVKALRR